VVNRRGRPATRHQVERLDPVDPADVAVDPSDGSVAIAGPCNVEHRGSRVDARDAVAGVGQHHGEPSCPASHVEHTERPIAVGQAQGERVVGP
jgi:hypothetical protein